MRMKIEWQKLTIKLLRRMDIGYILLLHIWLFPMYSRIVQRKLAMKREMLFDK